MRERILSEEKARISEAKKGKNDPWFGKTRSEETKASARVARETHPPGRGDAKLSEANGTAVEVLDTDSNETTTYSSGCQVAKALNCS